MSHCLYRRTSLRAAVARMAGVMPVTWLSLAAAAPRALVLTSPFGSKTGSEQRIGRVVAGAADERGALVLLVEKRAGAPFQGPRRSLLERSLDAQALEHRVHLGRPCCGFCPLRPQCVGLSLDARP